MKTRITRIGTNLETCPPHLFAPIFLPSSPIRANSCNSCLPSKALLAKVGLLFVVFAFFVVNFFVVTCSASTNDLATSLQKGLFEEEANHNFPAAIEAYQGVINRFDEDRKLAATAIFRVGEIYRKQGKTNEANAQYERVVREFSDQSTLATLSKSYLTSATALSANTPTTNASSELALTSDEAEEVRKIRAMIRDSPDLINAVDNGGNTRLHTAASLGQVVVARFLVENGANVDAQNRDGWTPLINAAAAGHKALVELLLDHRASTRLAASEGSTPLHAAASRGFRTIVEVLLSHGADVDTRTKTGSTPLHLAVVNDFKSVAELLLSHHADVNLVTSGARDEQNRTFNGTSLHIATARGDQSLAELLLTNKANPNATNSNGDTPLHLAAKNGAQKLTELLLGNGAAIDPIDGIGDTPLDASAREGRTANADFLLAHGANVNARNPLERGWKGWTPLLYAVACAHNDTSALLLKNKADPNARIDNGNMSLAKGTTSLLMAVRKMNAEMVAMLLESKADASLRDEPGSIPAFLAMEISDPPTRHSILSLLLDHGADPNTRNNVGATLLMQAVLRRDKTVVQFLLAHKADVNERSLSGSTAFHSMASSFSIADSNFPGSSIALMPEIAEALLAAGADVNLQDNNGNTALNLLLHRESSGAVFDVVRDKVIELLRAHGAVTDLPHLDAIEVRRLEANYSKAIFAKGTNGWEQFTLYELIGVQYHLLSAEPSGVGRPVDRRSTSFAPQTGLDFPDFAHIRIRHPKSNSKDWDERTIDVATALASSDCSADIPIQLGDQVEIPEADHVRYEKWEGLSKPILASLKKCLTRQVTVVVKGQSKNFTLTPEYSTNNNAAVFDKYGHAVEVAEVKMFAPFMIVPALTDSKLLLASSDLSRVKVSRIDSPNGQKRELIVDCSEGKPAPSVWLRDGDVIEVPDKP